MFHFLERSELRIHYREERGERKSPAPGGFLTHDLSVMRRVLYRCPEAIGLVADQRILAATVRLTEENIPFYVNKGLDLSSVEPGNAPTSVVGLKKKTPLESFY